jgi:hypothetical protein
MEGGRVDEPVAHVEFTEGALRPVFESTDGGQYVIGDDGERVYGVWYILREEFDAPAIVGDFPF